MAKAQLSVAFDQLGGSFGQFCLVPAGRHTIVRRKPIYKRASTPVQKACARRMTRAVALWHEMSTLQADAWRKYAASLSSNRAGSDKAVGPTGFNAFVGLATRFMQISGTDLPPLAPPMGSFIGDSAVVTVAPFPGLIRFTASQANAPGVVTELMLQKLAKPNRKPGKAYIGKAFVAFTQSGLSYDLSVEPGIYACAVRALESSTGRAWLVQQAGIVVTP